MCFAGNTRQRGSIISLLTGDVLDALLMASASKLCMEEFVKALAAHFLCDEPAREYDDIGVVVLADEMGNLRLPNQSGTDALMLV